MVQFFFQQPTEEDPDEGVKDLVGVGGLLVF